MDCVGLVSRVGNSTQISQAAAAAANAARAHKRTNTIIGVCVALVLLILIVGSALLFFLWRKRRQDAAETLEKQDTVPRTFPAATPGLSITLPTQPQPQSQPLSYKAALAYERNSGAGSSSLSTAVQSSQDEQLRSISQANSQDLTSDSESPLHVVSTGHYPPGFPSNPSPMSGRRQNKAAEAYARPGYGNDERRVTSMQPQMADRVQPPNRSMSANARTVDQLGPDAEPDIIIQHEDGGVVQELPPPYLDRSRPRPPP